MTEKRPFWIFFTHFWIFVRWTKIAITRSIFKILAFFFYMGPHYVDFTFAFETSLIRLEMTEIWPENAAQAFLPPPGIVSSEAPRGYDCYSTKYFAIICYCLFENCPELNFCKILVLLHKISSLHGKWKALEHYAFGINKENVCKSSK